MTENEFKELERRIQERLKRAQMSHEDFSMTKKRVQEAQNLIKEMIVPQTPAEWAATAALGPVGGKLFRGAMAGAAAMGSNDAEAAFIGPKGIERLRKLGKILIRSSLDSSAHEQRLVRLTRRMSGGGWAE